jgi:hypothetical protein
MQAMTGNLMPDEQMVLENFRRAKSMKHSGMEVAVKDGVIVKLDVTEKVNLESLKRCKE